MSAAWVAGTVRARALLDRRIGDEAARELAALPGPAAASARLARTPYRHFLPEGADAAAAERAVMEAVLWNLRVLAGWLPRSGTSVLRILAADFEIRNIADRLRALAGERTPAPYLLGALATAWRRASAAASAGELRRVLATSAWGDPGTDDPGSLVADLRLAAAARLAAMHDGTRAWGAGSAALAVARRRYLAGGRLGAASTDRARLLLGSAALDAGDFAAYAAALRRETAGWALDGITEPRELWRAEESWWARVGRDAQTLSRTPRFGPEPSIGCAALLLVDAHAVRRALAAAARGGGPEEDDDAHG